VAHAAVRCWRCHEVLLGLVTCDCNTSNA
jgi:hypothetical protein